MRCYLDGEERWICEPAWRWDDLDAGEMGPRLSWDKYLETWTRCDEIRMDMGFNYRDLDGFRIIPVFFTYVRHDLDRGETWMWWKLEMEHGWSRDLNGDKTGPVLMWVAHLQTLICLIWWLDESVNIFKTWSEVRRSMDWSEMQIYVHLLTWDTIWMGRACDYWSLDWGETITHGPGWEMGIGMIWDTPPETCLR